MKNCKNLIVKEISEIVNVDFLTTLLEEIQRDHYRSKNGPYDDRETALRPLIHIYVTSKKLSSVKPEYIRVADEAENLIIGFLKKFGLLFRAQEKKDATNGLMGPAWLCEAASISSNGNFRDVVAGLLNRHITHKQKVFNINNRPDFTFNHSLWFSYFFESMTRTGYQKTEDILHRISFTRENLINHLFGKYSSLPYRVYLRSRGLEASRIKLLGYHYFNMAIIKRCINSGVSVPFDYDAAMLAIDQVSQYGYKYNPIGVELAFCREFQEDCLPTWFLQKSLVKPKKEDNLDYDLTLLKIRLLEGVTI